MSDVYTAFQQPQRGCGVYGRWNLGNGYSLEFACVAVCSLLVRHHGSHACQSRAEVFLVDGLVLASCSAEVIRNSLCGGTATWSHFFPITSTCCCAPRVFRAVSWDLSMEVVVVLLVLSGGARATGRLSARCLQHVFYIWVASVQCPCGIVSAFFQGRVEVVASFLLNLSVFFVLWMVGTSALRCVTCYCYCFQLLLTLKVRWLVDGLS